VDFQVSVDQCLAQRFRMSQWDIEAIVDKEDLTQVEARLQVFDLSDNFGNRPNHAPGAVLSLNAGWCRGIVKPAKLGQHADPEAGLAVFGHVQVFQTRWPAELGGTSRIVRDDLASSSVYDSRQIDIRGFSSLQAVHEVGESFPGVADEAKVWCHIGEALFW
jgi:hypothetical protein